MEKYDWQEEGIQARRSALIRWWYSYLGWLAVYIDLAGGCCHRDMPYFSHCNGILMKIGSTIWGYSVLHLINNQPKTQQSSWWLRLDNLLHTTTIWSRNGHNESHCSSLSTGYQWSGISLRGGVQFYHGLTNSISMLPRCYWGKNIDNRLKLKRFNSN